jgi:hypothetical protein
MQALIQKPLLGGDVNLLRHARERHAPLSDR